MDCQEGDFVRHKKGGTHRNSYCLLDNVLLMYCVCPRKKKEKDTYHCLWLG